MENSRSCIPKMSIPSLLCLKTLKTRHLPPNITLSPPSLRAWHLLVPLPGVLFPRFLKLSPLCILLLSAYMSQSHGRSLLMILPSPTPGTLRHFLFSFYFLCRKLSFKMKFMYLFTSSVSLFNCNVSVLDSMSVLFLIITPVPNKVDLHK